MTASFVFIKHGLVVYRITCRQERFAYDLQKLIKSAIKCSRENVYVCMYERCGQKIVSMFHGFWRIPVTNPTPQTLHSPYPNSSPYTLPTCMQKHISISFGYLPLNTAYTNIIFWKQNYTHYSLSDILYYYQFSTVLIYFFVRFGGLLVFKQSADNITLAENQTVLFWKTHKCKPTFYVKLCYIV